MEYDPRPGINAELDRLRVEIEQLRKYATHKQICGMMFGKTICTCGYAALAKANETEGK